MIIPTHETVVHNRECAAALKARITDLLSDRDNYMKIISLLDEDENVELSLHDQDIYIIRIIAQTVKLEIENNSRYLLFDGRDVGDLIRLYKILSLYLRRIEFDFPNELQLQIFDYILKEKLSIVAIVSVIENNITIIDKKKVTENIMKLLESNI